MFVMFSDKESVMKKSIFALLAVVTLISTVGCNTDQGIGKDIERGGEAIQRSTK